MKKFLFLFILSIACFFQIGARHDNGACHYQGWKNPDTILIEQQVPARFVPNGYEVEYYLKTDHNTSFFSCIFCIDDNKIKYIKFSYDKEKISSPFADSDSIIFIANEDNDCCNFRMSFDQQLNFFSDLMEIADERYDLSELSNIIIDLLYLGDETINICNRYYQLKNKSKRRAINKIMTEAIEESNLYGQLNTILNRHHLKIANVCTENIIQVTHESFESENIVTIISPQEIVASVAYFSTEPYNPL